MTLVSLEKQVTNTYIALANIVFAKNRLNLIRSCAKRGDPA